jgi:hypothetical protein
LQPSRTGTRGEKVEHFAFFAQGVATGQGIDRAVFGGEAFEFHRRLPFVLHQVAQAEQAGGGVEPAAEAGGRRAAQVAGEHGEQRAGVAARVVLLDPAADAVAEAGAVQGGDGHAPRFLGGAVAAGHGQRAEVAETLAIGTIETQQFATPGAAVRAEADTIESPGR